MNKNKSTEVFCRPSGEVKKKKNHCKLFFHWYPLPPKTTDFKRGFSVPEKHLWEYFSSPVGQVCPWMWASLCRGCWGGLKGLFGGKGVAEFVSTRERWR